MLGRCMTQHSHACPQCRERCGWYAPTQVAMECAAEMGCAESVLRFVLPLGTTVNMNGTALYEATTVIFLAQVRTPVCHAGASMHL